MMYNKHVPASLICLPAGQLLVTCAGFLPTRCWESMVRCVQGDPWNPLKLLIDLYGHPVPSWIGKNGSTAFWVFCLPDLLISNKIKCCKFSRKYLNTFDPIKGM